MRTVITRIGGWMAAASTQVFPMFGRGAQMVAAVPTVAIVAACWATSYLRSGWPVGGLFTATLTLLVGIGIAAVVRVLNRALTRTIAATDDDGDIVLSISGLFVLNLVAGFLIATLIGGENPNLALAPLQTPATGGIALWFVHELIYCRWYYRKLQQGPEQPTETVTTAPPATDDREPDDARQAARNLLRRDGPDAWSAKELGAQFDRSARWGRDQLRAVREEQTTKPHPHTPKQPHETP